MSDPLKKAFIAGFNQSAQGFNGEHMPSIARESNAVESLYSEWADESELEKVPKSDLEELVERWREGQPEDPYRRAIWSKRNQQKLKCADELEEVIE